MAPLEIYSYTKVSSRFIPDNIVGINWMLPTPGYPVHGSLLCVSNLPVELPMIEVYAEDDQQWRIYDVKIADPAPRKMCLFTADQVEQF